MADKEASVFIIDVGAPMGDCHNGRSESDLDYGMRYVWDKISNTVAASRKTWTIGVLGLRTDDTRHALQDEDGYENISVLRDIGPMNMTSLKELQPVITPSGTEVGDAISAVVIAVDMIAAYTKKLKYKRRVYLITDGTAPMDGDDLGDITSKINDDGVELIVLGVDFDDTDYGFKEEDKPSLKKNEKILKDFVAKCDNGQFATIAEAIDELDTPRLKPVRPYKSYDGPLTLGDPKDPKRPSPVSINVERYFKTKLARPIAATTVVVKTDEDASQVPEDVSMEDAEFAGVKQMRTYTVPDPSAPGGKKGVEYDSLAKGYEYGRTAVHISESEFNITKLETTKSFTILGFIPNEKHEPFLNMGETCMTVARKFDEKSQIALSSLVHALYELSSYAVARLVLKDAKEPLLVLLAPSIEPDLECLYDIPLPFAEDVRTYRFPPLDRVVTVNGQTLTKHRLLPSDELADAMSDYVDAVDLSTAATGDDGEPAEFAPFDESFNPIIHRINQAVRNRAVKPEGAIEPIAPILLRHAVPPEALVEKAKSEAKYLVQAAEVKRVPPKAKSKRARETAQPISGLDIDALLGGQPKRPRYVSRENAIPDLIQSLHASTEPNQLEEIAKQMGEVIHDLVTESFGDTAYERALENLKSMRTNLVAYEVPQLYNDFLRDFKKRLLAGELGGDRREMWWRIRTARQGLVDKTQSDLSEISPEMAEDFLRAR
ncbi:SPOC like C-terminal domain-containing protein [Plectosphaerella plurivora]|uniref:ATP-dependent DNA helicase II subunit 2 n=1 Tax=Plectosphaerella plurivora TaxID=936078 RepID=A0A9P8VBS8_9PEZI|nr:SPOC like C-terminal domain-containing protein [Plectosphaerella plurivora]